MHKELLKSKTLWTGVSAIVAAAGSFAVGEIEIAQAIQVVVTALIGIFIRDGMVK